MRRVEPSEAIGRKYPEWIVVIVSKDAQGKVNFMPAGWSMVTSGEPLLFAVSVAPERYTHKCITDRNEFVVAFPAPGMGPAIAHSGNYSGRDVDKATESGFRTTPAAAVEVPLVEGAVANLECKVVSSHETGDHTIFVGEVVAAHVEDDAPGRLVNFGPDGYALARPDPDTLFQP